MWERQEEGGGGGVMRYVGEAYVQLSEGKAEEIAADRGWAGVRQWITTWKIALVEKAQA